MYVYDRQSHQPVVALDRPIPLQHLRPELRRCSRYKDERQGLISVEQVLRWSALGAGIFYGFYHQQSIKSRAIKQKEQAEWAHKENLISQAKAQWAKEHPQPAQKASSGTDTPFPSLQQSFLR